MDTTMRVYDVTGLESITKEEAEGKETKHSKEEIEGEKDTFVIQPNFPSCANHLSISADLVQKDVEEGVHTLNPAQTNRTEETFYSSNTPLTSLEAFIASDAHKSETKSTSEVLVRKHDDSAGLDHPQSPLIKTQVLDSESSLEKLDDRTSVDDSPSIGHRGSDGNPKEPNIKTSSLGAKDLLAKFGSCVDLEDDSSSPVTKVEFKAFVDGVYVALGELKSLAKGKEDVAAKTKNAETVAELKKTTAQNSLDIQKLVQASATMATQEDINRLITTVDKKTEALKVLGKIVMDETPKAAAQTATSAVDDLEALRSEIKNMARSAIVPLPPSTSQSQKPAEVSHPSTLASKAELHNMWEKLLQEVHKIGEGMVSKGRSVLEELKRTVALMKFHTDNEAEASQKKRSHDDQGSDGFGPSGRHEGEKALPALSENPIAATPLNVIPQKKGTSEGITQRSKSCASKMKKLNFAVFIPVTPAELSVKAKINIESELIAEGIEKFVEPSSPELMPVAPIPSVQFSAQEPINAKDDEVIPQQNLPKKTLSESKVKGKTPSAVVATEKKKPTEDQVKSIVESTDAMRIPILRPPKKELSFHENIYSYLYSTECEEVFL
ncbi:hypothetical protein L6452_18252 [Arctium lappa]|uniref:Uncharacterized protein n=1 Tax=Arctium lappa TaxID=4217 RepID=A0ACB9C5M4_ARCLA|nr:hypothetical protein L6452_18252 [Arctium lappa]